MLCFVLLFVLSFSEMCFRSLLCVFVSAGLSFNFGFWVFLLAWVFLSWISGFLFSSFVVCSHWSVVCGHKDETINDRATSATPQFEVSETERNLSCAALQLKISHHQHDLFP